jgi:cytochrome c oxidase assembly protein subunit 15
LPDDPAYGTRHVVAGLEIPPKIARLIRFPPVEPQAYNRAVHCLALITATATFPLIFMGGLVTSHQAGMSVPDWPNSWGYNMFTFPPSKWVGGILFEHTHRLAGTAVGIIAIILTFTAWKTEKRKWVRWTATSILAVVTIQGILGGLRVLRSSRDFAIVHGCVAQVVFCFMAAFCVLTSRFWLDPPRVSPAAMRATRNLGLLTVAIILCQLVVGAIMRHSDAGLAIPDFPLSYGHILPPTSLDSAFREAAIHDYGTTLGLNHVTLFQIWIHFAHRIGAVLVSIAVITLATTIFLKLRHEPKFVTPALIVLGLLASQVTLGILTVLMRKPADIASAHVAVGALLLVMNWTIALRAIGVIRHADSANAHQRELQYATPVS